MAKKNKKPPIKMSEKELKRILVLLMITHETLDDADDLLKIIKALKKLLNW